MTPFGGSEKEAFWKHCGKGEIACTSNLSFSYNVSYAIKDRNCHFCYIEFVVCKCFQFGLVQNFVVLEWVNICVGHEAAMALFYAILSFR